MRVCVNDVHVWNGRAGGRRERCAVEIEDGVIAAVRPAGDSTADVVLEGDGRWVIPGLIDCHMHFFGARRSNPVDWCLDDPMRGAVRAVADARRLLEAGFTAVRDAGSRIGPALRDGVAAGEIAGPRVHAAWLGISRTGGHGDVHSLPLEVVRERPFMALIADGPDECRRAVRQIARAGADWVKVWATGGVLSERDNPRHTHLLPHELEVIVTEAHEVGLKVGAHCEGLAATKACVAAGVDFIEHGFYLDDEVCTRMAERGVALITTVSFICRTAEWQGDEVPKYARDEARTVVDDCVASLQTAYRNGVTIAMGTDTFSEPLTPFGRNADELLALRDAGMTVEDCLVAATSTASGVLGMEDEIGTLEPGKDADLLVLGHDSPLDDLTAVTGDGAISLVLQRGRPVGGNELEDWKALWRHEMREEAR